MLDIHSTGVHTEEIGSLEAKGPIRCLVTWYASLGSYHVPDTGRRRTTGPVWPHRPLGRLVRGALGAL